MIRSLSTTNLRTQRLETSLILNQKPIRCGYSLYFFQMVRGMQPTLIYLTFAVFERRILI